MRRDLIILSKKYDVLSVQAVLASSNAPVSEDLKFKIAELINEKKSDEEIKTFVSQRYGNQSLYDPGLSNETYILWFAPFIFLLIASIVFIMRSKR